MGASALCCSHVPFGEGVWSGLGFDSFFVAVPVQAIRWTGLLQFSFAAEGLAMKTFIWTTVVWALTVVACCFSLPQECYGQPKKKPKTKEKEVPRLPENRALKVGDVGTLDSCSESVPTRAWILQVIDENNALIEIRNFRGVDFDRNVLQVKETVWLTAPTDGMVDDRGYKSDQIFEVVGTKRYQTARGTSKTVMVIKPVDPAELTRRAEAEQAAKQAAEKAKQEAIQAAKKKVEEAKRRTWTSGKYKVDAVFITVISGKVRLKRVDNGKMIMVPLERLSKEDQEFIRERKWLEKPQPSKKP